MTLLAASSVFAQSTPNPDFYYGAVIEAFHKHDPQMVHFSLLYRGEASGDLDVILVRGGRYRDDWRQPPGTLRYVKAGDLLGLFLVDRSNTALAYELVIDSTFNGGYEAAIGIERAAPGEITIFPIGDYGRSGPRRKYAYSASARRFLWMRDLWGRGLDQLTRSAAGPVIWGKIPPPTFQRRGSTVLAVTPKATGFQVQPADVSTELAATALEPSKTFGPGNQCVIEEARELGAAGAHLIVCSSIDGPQLFHAPQTDFARFAAARPAKVSYGYTEEQAMFNETIGPYQIDGDRLWFGLTFYDGEGMTGVGGFGFFDAATQQFEMYYPPEIADWSVSALFGEPNAVWLALSRRTEGADYSGGLSRWDRATQEIQRWPDAPLIHGITRLGNRLYMATGEGAAIFEDGKFIRYVLDVDEQGEYSLALRELR